MNSKLAFFALALIGSHGALASEQFDLLCTAKNDSRHYRIDLTTSQWCAEDCKDIHKIVSVSQLRIVLVDMQETHEGAMSASTSINRETGEWQSFLSIPNVETSMAKEGKCVPAAFSGFPTLKTLF